MPLTHSPTQNTILLDVSMPESTDNQLNSNVQVSNQNVTFQQQQPPLPRNRPIRFQNSGHNSSNTNNNNNSSSVHSDSPSHKNASLPSSQTSLEDNDQLHKPSKSSTPFFDAVEDALPNLQLVQSNDTVIEEEEKDKQDSIYKDAEIIPTKLEENSDILFNKDNLVRTGGYIQDKQDDKILLNKRVYRLSKNLKHRKDTQDSARSNLPFLASKHSQIMPVDMSLDSRPTNLSGNSAVFTSSKQIESRSNSPSKKRISKTTTNDGSQRRSDSATQEIKKMRETLVQNRETRKKRKSCLIDDDHVLIGNRVSEGHINFIIAYNMLTGIRVAVSRCSGVMKPLTQEDFRYTKKLAFDYHGNELTPSSQYAFKFKDYCPEVFREIRSLFGLDPADYLVSLTSKYILSELNSPGKSGSFFYYSRDYRYIIKTIHHSEHMHLRKHLKDYYTHVKNNPNTLICQFYGLHRVKMPISFQNKVKHRKIYFLVMNNLFPPHLAMDRTFDLKGSTWKRFTPVDTKLLDTDPTYRPVMKDLNWIDMEGRIKFGPEKKSIFLDQLKKDVKLLSKLNTMDYSLLLGIHYKSENNESDFEENQIMSMNPGLIRPHYFKAFEGGIRGSDENNEDIEIIYYVGIIDCLTNYSILKKLETFWRGLRHDLKIVSAIPPNDYAKRFYEFIDESVDTAPPKHFKDDPKAKRYRD